MWLDEEKPILKQDLVLNQPFVNGSGTLGFVPDLRAQPAISRLGAFITNPISRKARQPAANRACLPFQGGFLLHSGHPNPGITRAIGRFGRRWAGASLPVIVHLLVESPATLTEMVHKLEGLENMLAVELGLPPGCDPGFLSAVMAAGAGMLAATQVLIGAGLRVIASGGVHDAWQVDALMKAGAIAVGLGSVLWQVDPTTLFPEFQP